MLSCAIVKLKNGVTGDYGQLPEKKLRGQPLNLAIFLGEVEPEAGDDSAKPQARKPAPKNNLAGKQENGDEEEDEDDDEDEDEDKEDEEDESAPSPVPAKNKPKLAPVNNAPTSPRPSAGAGGKQTVVVTSIPFETSMEDVKTYLQKQSPTNVFMPTRPDGRHKGCAISSGERDGLLMIIDMISYYELIRRKSAHFNSVPTRIGLRSSTSKTQRQRMQRLQLSRASSSTGEICTPRRTIGRQAAAISSSAATGSRIDSRRVAAGVPPIQVTDCSFASIALFPRHCSESISVCALSTHEV